MKLNPSDRVGGKFVSDGQTDGCSNKCTGGTCAVICDRFGAVTDEILTEEVRHGLDGAKTFLEAVERSHPDHGGRRLPILGRGTSRPAARLIYYIDGQNRLLWNRHEWARRRQLPVGRTDESSASVRLGTAEPVAPILDSHPTAQYLIHVPESDLNHCVTK